MASKTEKVVLGSGILYYSVFDGEIPEDATIETQSNILGYVKGGATLEYKPEYYEAKDDLGKVCKPIVTDEEVTLKSGIMTWNGESLSVLCNTAVTTEDAASHTRTVKIGGAGNFDGRKYLFHFVHTDRVDGKTSITIVGQNQAGFSLTFTKDEETVIDAEFKALPHDNNGTLIIYKEEDQSITSE